MRIQVLFFEGCPNYGPAIELVRSIAPDATIEAVEIKTQQDAERMRFLGSPTILVDGMDVEPEARTRTDFGFTCRTYGGRGLPSRELVASAIRCCSPGTTARPRSRWLAASSVVVAAIASVCCWLPLALLALGMSTVGLSSTFETFRPWLLAVAVALLSFGFYSAYRNGACCTPQSRRLNRVMVWMAAALVLAFALFPLYAAAIMGPIGGPACCTSKEAACCTPESDTPTARQVALIKQKTSVTVLSDDAHELKDAFNADKDAPRVMLIVSPLCPACRAGASVVQKEVLAQIDSDKLKVYVVWINRFPGDSRKAAQEATQLVSDKRAGHFWDGTGAVGKLFGRTVKLPREKTFAWDVYFVFGPKAEWTADPPIPTFWMHQLGGPETGNLLDGEKFLEALVKQLRE